MCLDQILKFLSLVLINLTMSVSLKLLKKFYHLIINMLLLKLYLIFLVLKCFYKNFLIILFLLIICFVSVSVNVNILVSNNCLRNVENFYRLPNYMHYTGYVTEPMMAEDYKNFDQKFIHFQLFSLTNLIKYESNKSYYQPEAYWLLTFLVFLGLLKIEKLVRRYPPLLLILYDFHHSNVYKI